MKIRKSEKLQWDPGLIEREGWPENRVWRFFFCFFQLFSNFPLPYRSETIRNGFPVKFRIDIGPEDLKKHFSLRKIIKKSSKITKIDSRSPAPPVIYYMDPHWKFWVIFEKKNRAKIFFFFEHETKTKKFDPWNQCSGPSGHAAQLLELLEHSGYAKSSVKKFSDEMLVKNHENACYHGDPHCDHAFSWFFTNISSDFFHRAFRIPRVLQKF